MKSKRLEFRGSCFRVGYQHEVVEDDCWNTKMPSEIFAPDSAWYTARLKCISALVSKIWISIAMQVRSK